MNPQDNAPGCFAAASVFSHDSNICRMCMAFDACAVASLETLEAIQGIVNVKDLLKRHQSAKKLANEAIKAADEKREASMPPGNVEPPLPKKPVERKTQVLQVKFEVSSDEEAIIALLPSKPRDIAIRMCKKGEIEALRNDIAEGRNTFAQSGPAFLRVAVALLLTGGFSKSGLRFALQTELKWSEGTAGSHVSIACALFAAFEIAQEIEGRLVLTPTVSA